MSKIEELVNFVTERIFVPITKIECKTVMVDVQPIRANLLGI
jgi:hypothetical protein